MRGTPVLPAIFCDSAADLCPEGKPHEQKTSYTTGRSLRTTLQLSRELREEPSAEVAASCAAEPRAPRAKPTEVHLCIGAPRMISKVPVSRPGVFCIRPAATQRASTEI